MSIESPGTDDHRLTVVWYGDSPASTEFSADDVVAIVRLIEQDNEHPQSINCATLGLVQLLEALAPLGALGLDEFHVNGTCVVHAATRDGAPALVPESNEPVVTILDVGSASWLPGGPCLMDQREELLCIDDLYWADASGDSVNRRVVAGRFEDPAEGFAACVAASTFFRLDDAGKSICELDEWPQEE